MTINIDLKHDLFDLSIEDFSRFANLSPDYITELTAFGMAPHSWVPTLLTSSLFTFDSGTGYTMSVSGSGIGPVTSLADLEAAFNAGFATGNLDSIVINDGSNDILAITMTASGYNYTSGSQVLAIQGATPTSLSQFFALTQVFDALMVIDTLSPAEINQLMADLSAYDINDITLSDHGTDLLGFSFGATSVSLDLMGYKLALDGVFPADFGQALAMLVEVSSLMQSGNPFDLSDITGLALDRFSITDPDGVELLTTSGTVLGDGSDTIGVVTVDGVVTQNLVFGTDGDDMHLNGIKNRKSNDHVFGLGGDDFLSGWRGNDHLFGGDGNDEMFGDAGRDVLFGGSGNDTLDGGNGNDVINPGSNNGWDTVYGSNGNDRILYFDNGPGGYQQLSYAFMGAGIDAMIDGAAKVSTVDKGVNGTDILRGVKKPMKAGYHTDTGGFALIGTNYDDSFTVDGGYADTWFSVDGGSGADSYDITLTGMVRLDFKSGWHWLDIDVATGQIVDDGHGNAETLNLTDKGGLLEIRATAQDDVIHGSALDERFILLEGDDFLDGRGGTDMVRYDRPGAGAVDLDLQAGTATGTWYGNAFTHYLHNIEDVRGSAENDGLRGDGGANALWGRAGNDLLVGRGGADRLFGEDGNDKLSGGMGKDELFGGDGDDRLFGNNGRDFLFGGDGNDVLDGGNGNDVLNPGSNTGGDTIVGSNGNDRILYHDNGPGGMQRLDYSHMGAGIDATIDGGAGRSTIDKGVNGTDILRGVIKPMKAGYHTSGGFYLTGTNHDDSFTVDGGYADTWFSVNGGSGVDSYDVTLSGIVRLDFMGGSQGLDVTLRNGQIIDDGHGNAEILTLTDNGGTLEIQATNHDDVISGSDRDERFILLGGNDLLDGGDGVDLVRYDRAGIGPVDVNLQAGTATGTWYGNAFSHILMNIENGRGSAANDSLWGDGSANTFWGREGNDLLVGRGGADRLFGEDGNDKLLGGMGKDKLFGGAGNDKLFGGAGNDILRGNAGNDVLRGDAGQDQFFFTLGDGRDRVVDFVDDVDTLKLDQDLWGGGLTKAELLASHADDTGSDVVFNFGNGDILTLTGFADKADLIDDITFI